MRMIDRDDMRKLNDMAKKYNMSISDFGRAMVRQSERSIGRAVRLSESEYKYIRETAQKNNLPAARFIALACHAFAKIENKSIPIEYRVDRGNRTKRLEARIYNNADEAEIVRTATAYSMKISTLIRFCAMHFDGKEIHLDSDKKGENDNE